MGTPENQNTLKLIIIGAGGLGREVAWAASRPLEGLSRYEFCGFSDDDPVKKGKTIGGLRVLGSIEESSAGIAGPIYFICGVGDNRQREALVARAASVGWLPATVIDSSVIVGPGVEVGEGSYVGALSILSPSALIGRHVIINHGCSIGHDSQVGDFGQVCPGGRVSGLGVLGRGAFMGSNSVIGPGAQLGDYAVLGAASFVTKSVPAGATAIGNPARVIFRAN